MARVLAFQAKGCGFDPRLPLHFPTLICVRRSLFRSRPCGSVVEHALGKGEIRGSILRMGSIFVGGQCCGPTKVCRLFVRSSQRGFDDSENASVQALSSRAEFLIFARISRRSFFGVSHRRNDLEDLRSMLIAL